MSYFQRVHSLLVLPPDVRREFAHTAILANVPEAGTTVIAHGEPLDAWAVLLVGAALHTPPEGSVRELGPGDSFGVTVQSAPPDQPPDTQFFQVRCLRAQ